MSPDTPINLPKDLVARLEARAKALGIDLVSYIRFLEASASSANAGAVRDAVRHIGHRFPDTMRKLAQ